jgi:hypothetical protein
MAVSHILLFRAAYMTGWSIPIICQDRALIPSKGIERNSDIVFAASYAPLLMET